MAWQIAPGLTPYPAALAAMEARVAAIRAGEADELVWLVEHPPLYTAGTSARPQDLLEPGRFPVFSAGRGGEYTYHGPGQRVAYLMLDLRRRRPDVRAFVAALETWIIRALAELGVEGERRDDRIGVWVVRPDRIPRQRRARGHGRVRPSRQRGRGRRGWSRRDRQCRRERCRKNARARAPR